MNALRLLIEPVFGGWTIRLSDGRLVARFWGPWAHRRAEAYLAAFAA